MNFGLCETPFSFQNYINNILYEYLDDFCSVYIDDILIYNKNKKEHIRHIRLIFQRLRDAKLQMNIQKYFFEITEIKYFKLIIIIDEIRINMKKIFAILN